jgi:antitoxin (DNA-binding transcriptional repressor) of toxin-antitoxin stability system
MPIPKLNFEGETATITMMELRSNPGEILDRVSRGLSVLVTKQGKWIATMRAPSLSDPEDDSPIVVRPDGTIEGGRKPLTFGLNLGCEYAASTQ